MSKRTNRESFKRVSDYSHLLTLPQWQERRLRVLEHAEWRCQICGSNKETIHVHHSYYTKGKKPWEYPLGSMIAVCATHHAMIHDARKKAPAPPLTATIAETVSVSAELSGMDQDAPASPERAAMYFKQMREALAKRVDAA